MNVNHLVCCPALLLWVWVMIFVVVAAGQVRDD